MPVGSSTWIELGGSRVDTISKHTIRQIGLTRIEGFILFAYDYHLQMS